jgi:multimeric flavodoxin WrbA
MLKADAIVFGSPTYFSNVSGIMKNFIDRCLPFYFSERMKDRKVAFATVGNFHHLLEFKRDGNCKWHKEEIASVKSALKSLEDFANILQMKIIGSVYALHSEPEKYDKKLNNLGKRLIS